MKIFFLKLRFIVSLICVFLVFILFIKIYFVYSDLSVMKSEKENVSFGIAKAKEERTKLEETLGKIEKLINEYSDDRGFQKEIEKDWRLLNEIYDEEKRLEKLKKNIDKQKVEFASELKGVKDKIAKLIDEYAKLKKEEEGLKDASNSEKANELKTKEAELDKKLKSYSFKKIEYENKIKKNESVEEKELP